MTTIYNRIERDFTIVSNSAILDNRITGKAYKLYCYMVMRIGASPTWKFNHKEISKHFKEKKDAIYVAFDELIKNGWLVRRQKRANNGRFESSEFEIFSRPQITESSPCPDFPDTDKPDTGKSDSEEPDAENPDYYKEGSKEDKDNINNNPNNTLESPPTPQEKNGAFKFEGGVNKLVSMISGKALDLAKSNSKGWDIYYLMGIYIEGIPKRGFPKDINKAFPAWCLAYTKGKKPD